MDKRKQTSYPLHKALAQENQSKRSEDQKRSTKKPRKKKPDTISHPPERFNVVLKGSEIKYKHKDGKQVLTFFKFLLFIFLTPTSLLSSLEFKNSNLEIKIQRL